MLHAKLLIISCISRSAMTAYFGKQILVGFLLVDLLDPSCA
ncbi:hypothetical protein HSIEG1_1889 [Enterococcus sp. HSIEG1]|nr:hypothetical protein HSIEG1_1889 [Enterococcus sp. HSIEG1]